MADAAFVLKGRVHIGHSHLLVFRFMALQAELRAEVFDKVFVIGFMRIMAGAAVPLCDCTMLYLFLFDAEFVAAVANVAHVGSQQQRVIRGGMRRMAGDTTFSFLHGLVREFGFIDLCLEVIMTGIAHVRKLLRKHILLFRAVRAMANNAFIGERCVNTLQTQI